ncbi:MAG: hypothetical protein QXI20_08175 [Candidatus Jordarchaeales archaeon]
MLKHSGAQHLHISPPDAFFPSLVGILTFLLLAVNPPLLVDDFYHLSVSRQIYLFGFIPTWDFWEFAPLGRPHLYPPLLHLIMALLMRASGGDVFLAARIVKTFTYPLLLLLFWLSVRGLAGRKAAFYSSLTLASASPLLFLSVMTMPATIVLALTPPLITSFIKKKTLPSLLLLSVALWLHFSMPVTAVATLLALSLVRREEYLKFFVKIASAALLTYLPWLIHIANHAEWISTVQAGGTPFIPFIAWALALPSIMSTLKYKDNACLAYLFYAISLLVFISYMTRLCLYLLIPLSFFAGITLSKIKWSKRRLKAALMVMLTLSFLVATPAVGGTPQTMDPFQPFQPPPLELAFIKSNTFLSFSSLLTLVLWPPHLKGQLMPTMFPIYVSSIWVAFNAPQPVCYIGLDSSHAVAVTALTGLPTSSGMWREVVSLWTLAASWWFALNQAVVYIVEAPFTAPPQDVSCRLVLDLGTVKVFVRT